MIYEILNRGRQAGGRTEEEIGASQEPWGRGGKKPQGKPTRSTFQLLALLWKRGL